MFGSFVRMLFEGVSYLMGCFVFLWVVVFWWLPDDSCICDLDIWIWLLFRIIVDGCVWSNWGFVSSGWGCTVGSLVEYGKKVNAVVFAFRNTVPLPLPLSKVPPVRFVLWRDSLERGTSIAWIVTLVVVVRASCGSDHPLKWTRWTLSWFSGDCLLPQEHRVFLYLCTRSQEWFVPVSVDVLNAWIRERVLQYRSSLCWLCASLSPFDCLWSFVVVYEPLMCLAFPSRSCSSLVSFLVMYIRRFLASAAPCLPSCSSLPFLHCHRPG